MSHFSKENINSKYASAFARCYFCENLVNGLNLVGVEGILHNACTKCGEEYDRNNPTKPETDNAK